MGSQHCNNKLPSREDVTGVIVKGGVMAKITNGDKFSNWSWWIAVSPFCKSTVFTRLGFHISVWLYIALANIAYFLVFFGGKKGVAVDEEIGVRVADAMEKVDSFAIRLLTWLLAGFIGHVVTAYYINVRKKASEMIQGLVHLVDGISVSVDYSSPRASAFLNDLYGALRATAHYALAHGSANTKFKLKKDELRAIFDDHGYDGKYMTSHQKKQTVTVMRLAILRSLEEEKDASESCLKKSYNNFREENIRQSLTQFAAGAMSTISCVSSNKLPFAYVHLLTWATRTFLLFHIFLTYFSHSLKHLDMGSKQPFSCYDSSLVFDGVDDAACFTEEFIVFNAFHILAVYFLMGILEVYPTLMKTWQSQLVLKNYKLVIDLICEPLKPDTYGRPKNLLQLKKKAFDENGDNEEGVERKESCDEGIDMIDESIDIDFTY